MALAGIACAGVVLSERNWVTPHAAAPTTATVTTAAPATSGPLRRFWGAESSR